MKNVRMKPRLYNGSLDSDGWRWQKLELAVVPQILEPEIDWRGDQRWLGFFGEKSDLGEFERKVTMGWAKDMPWEGLCISPNEDGIGHFVKVPQIQFGARSSSKVQDDDNTINGAWLEAYHSKTI
ncbi:hypothetical protein SO802_011407 [Lithocarpus litseifolius]|uniref:Uncharacterized protein n=1 Tax=Lithocarpus litseifolius TaxID=425828 RepID=A0AAW2D590_9ROSI